jgi:hypothetical protein
MSKHEIIKAQSYTILKARHTSLYHEILNHTVESASFVVKRFAHGAISLLASAESSKVFGRFWYNIHVNLHDNPKLTDKQTNKSC